MIPPPRRVLFANLLQIKEMQKKIKIIIIAIFRFSIDNPQYF
jgi:hypothetical protein